MRRPPASVIAWLAAAALCPPALSQTISTLKVGWCARIISAGAAPYAVATRMGWFKQEGVEVSLVPLAGSSDCVKAVATEQIPFALSGLEPHAAAFLQGIKAKTFYTAYRNIFSLAVPVDSSVQKVGDLKGKTIGVVSMGSGVLFAKALVASAGLNPDTDVKIVVVGEGAQTAAMIRGKQVDALSQFDTQYALVENAGVKLRMLESKEIERFPGNGFLALDKTLRDRRADAVALARGYAKGTIFAMNNPEAAVRMLYEVFPAVRPTGKDEAAAIRDDVKVLQVRIRKWALAREAVNRWGENSAADYSEYLDFLLKWGVLNAKVRAQDLITNELIDEINSFDSGRVAADAKAYGVR